MDSQAAALLAGQGGVVGGPQLDRLGIPAREPGRWVAAGELTRLRRGAYVDAGAWAAADHDEQYRLRVRAYMVSRATDDAASHHSALALHGLPLWHVDRRLVVLSADVEQTTTTSGLRLMPLRSLAATTQVDGLTALSVADAVVTTSSMNVEAGVVAGDAALHTGRCTLGELVEASARLRRGVRGRARLRRALAALDGAAESPGESRTRLVLAALGLPVESQVPLCDDQGELVGRVDFLVAGRVVVEFDGAVKYSGDGGVEALLAEKRREDQLRELGYAVVRLTWDDLAHPQRVLARVRAALLRQAA